MNMMLCIPEDKSVYVCLQPAVIILWDGIVRRMCSPLCLSLSVSSYQSHGL
jgi:hypothetical protein